MDNENSYPSPNAAQMSSGNGPFYQQVGEIPTSLQQLNQELQDQHLQAAANRTVEPPQTLPLDCYPHQASHHMMGHVHHSSGDSVAQGLAQGVLNMDSQVFASSPPEDNPKKRTKASRACDECRRKKVRCDSTLTASCSNCMRNKVDCVFTREPQKRGPSKGYIKELSARVHILEERQANQQANMMRPMTEQDFAYTPHLQDSSVSNAGMDDLSSQADLASVSRKRARSSDGDDVYARQSPYAPTMRYSAEQQPAHQQTALPQTALPQTALQQTALPQTALPQTALPQTALQQTALQQNPITYTQQFENRADQPITGYVMVAGSDTTCIDGYYRIIHETFPLLPHSAAKLNAQLATCTPILRSAFVGALKAAVGSLSMCTIMTTDHEAKLAYEAAVESIQELDTTIGPPAASHVYVQTLALMALASHIGGPTTFKMPLGKDWLVQAVLAARDLRLHTIDSAMALTDDLDEMPRLGKRIWWTLFILVRWSASSAANEWMRETLRELGPRDHLCEEDRTTLGETTWNLARLSYVAGHISTMMKLPAAETPKEIIWEKTANNILQGEIARIRESVNSFLVTGPNLVQLAYHHMHLLTLRLHVAQNDYDHIQHVRTLHEHVLHTATMLKTAYRTRSPLFAHFAVLAGVTLVQMRMIEGTEEGITDLLQALDLRRGLMSRPDSLGWEQALKKLLKLDAAGLREKLRLLEQEQTSLLQEDRIPNIRDRNPDIITPAQIATNPHAMITADILAFDATLLTKTGHLNVLAALLS